MLAMGCSVDPQIDDLPCPCADGFTCVAGRCVEGAPGEDAGPGDAGDPATDAGPGEDAGAPATQIVIDFSEGDHSDTEPGADGSLMLDGSSDGVYRSAVLEVTATSPNRIAWTPDAPYSKPLPRGRAEESGYAAGGFSMSENVVLYDFPDMLASAGEAVPDLSGRGNDGVIVGTVPAAPVDALVGYGYAFTDVNWLETSLDSTDDLQMGASDWTWMTWTRTTQSSEGMVFENRTFFGMEEQGTRDPHIWFGTSHSCNGGEPGATAGGTLRSSAGTDSDSYCGASVVNDGEWHLVTMTKRGHPDATITVFVDGAPESSTPMRFDGPFVFSEGAAMSYGDFPGSFMTTADFAQITIFRRALESREVADAHRRAALRVEVRLRACGDAACSADPPFVGPDGTADTAFRDPATSLSPPVEHDIELGDAPYFQVEVRLESDRDGETPRISDMSLYVSP